MNDVYLTIMLTYATVAVDIPGSTPSVAFSYFFITGKYVQAVTDVDTIITKGSSIALDRK